VEQGDAGRQKQGERGERVSRRTRLELRDSNEGEVGQAATAVDRNVKVRVGGKKGEGGKRWIK